MAFAASIMIGAIGFTWWNQPVHVVANFAEQKIVSLPDGSTVSLNSGSSLTYPRRFRGERNVSLEGEAYFAVTHNSNRFTVNTFNANIAVLGTEFNVRSWEHSLNPSTVVTLTEGSVGLSPTADPENLVVMKPGETRRIVQNSAVVSEASIQNLNDVAAWTEGNLVYRDEWLGVILEDIERRFAIEIELQATDLLKKEFTYVSRQPQTAEAVISGLCEALGLRYSQTSRGVSIYRPVEN